MKISLGNIVREVLLTAKEFVAPGGGPTQPTEEDDRRTYGKDYDAYKDAIKHADWDEVAKINRAHDIM